MKDDQANLPSERQVWAASIISALAHAVENNHPWSVYPSEAAALLAEIERLRAEAELGCSVRLRADVQRLRGHRESCTENLLKGYETGKAEERAAVVAFLQAASQRWAVDDPLNEAADHIERGEHRREEKG